MPLIFAFIARGNTVLCEHTAYTGNFSQIATQCLEKCPDHDSRFTYTCDRHTFNYLIAGGFTYLAVADEEYGRQIPFAFLERVKEDFSHGFADRARTAIAHSLNNSYGPRLQDHMKFCTQNPEELSKVAKVQSQVSEVKEIMMDNIEKVLDRGEKIELLVDKTETLRFQADSFHRTGRQLRRRMWMQNLKMKLLLAFIIIAIILIVFCIACFGGGKNCTK